MTVFELAAPIARQCDLEGIRVEDRKKVRLLVSLFLEGYEQQPSSLKHVGGVAVHSRMIRRLIGQRHDSKWLNWLLERGFLRIVKNYSHQSMEGFSTRGNHPRYYALSEGVLREEKVVIRRHKPTCFASKPGFEFSEIEPPEWLMPAYERELATLSKIVIPEEFEEQIRDATKYDKSLGLNYDCFGKKFLRCPQIPICNGWRSYNFINGIPQSLRKLIRLGSYRVQEIDLSNSHPFFLSIHLLGAWDQWDDLGVKPPIPFPSWNLPQDVQDFVDLTFSGTLYEYIEANLAEDEDVQLELYLAGEVLSRKVCKVALLEWINRDFDTQFKAVQRGISRLFPSVYEWLSELKAVDHRNASALLMRTESIFIRSAMLEADCDYLSIHDAVLTRGTRRKLKAVRDILISKQNQLTPTCV